MIKGIMGVIFRRRNAALASLLIIIMSIVANRVGAQETIDGHRLFFTEAQRRQAAGATGEQSSHSLPGDAEKAQGKSDTAAEGRPGSGSQAVPAMKSARDSKARPVQQSVLSRQAGDATFQVYFTGLVVGRRSTQVLVNGLPCRWATNVSKIEATQARLLECPGVTSDALVLRLSPSEGVLMVKGVEQQMHRLVPGEGW